jgi:hypothetical protein
MGEPTDRRLVSKTSENQVRLLAPVRGTAIVWRMCMQIINSIVEKRFVRPAEPHSLPAPPVRLGWAADAPGRRQLRLPGAGHLA